MRRVYQRHPALAVAALLAAAACGPADSTAERPAPERPAAPPPAELELYLAARAYELASHGAAGAELLATEHTAATSRAVLVPRESPATPRHLTAAESECRAIAALASGVHLVECAEPASGAITLRLRPATGGEQRLPTPAGLGRETLLALGDGGATLWTATEPTADAPARLMATTVQPLARRPVFSAPAGFAVVAVAPAAALAALRREVAPDAHEVVLHDWRRGESRLLLPTDADGRFDELQFVDGGRGLLLLADDGRDLPRLERLDLASGRRAPWGAPLRCPPRRLGVHADATVTVEVACDGRREAVRLDAAGSTLPLPAVPPGVRIVDWQPDGAAGALVVVTAGERWPSEIGRAEVGGDFHPRTYSLAPRLAPAAMPAPRALRLTSAGEELPAELWPAAAADAAAVVVWFEDATVPPRFGEHRPLAAALVAQGVTTLLVRGRGSDGPSRRLRHAADGDPAGAAFADLRAAAAATAGMAPPAAPRLLVGEGGWWGAAAVALAADESPYAAHFALFPADDPLAAAVERAPESAPTTSAARRSDPAAERLSAQREAWRFPVERARRPLWVALDPRLPAAASAAARVDAAAAAGLAVASRSATPRRFVARLPGELERELARRLLDAAR